MRYFPIRNSFLELIEPLRSAERGRLFTALLTYISTGVAPTLRKKEQFVFTIMRQQIDGDTEKYKSRYEASQGEACAYKGRAKGTGGGGSKQVYSSESEPYWCASYLCASICTRLNKRPYVEKRLQGWAKQFDKLNCEDGHSWEDIKAVLQFSQEAPFWQAIVKTARVFREQYQRIYESMQN